MFINLFPFGVFPGRQPGRLKPALALPCGRASRKAIVPVVNTVAIDHPGTISGCRRTVPGPDFLRPHAILDKGTIFTSHTIVFGSQNNRLPQARQKSIAAPVRSRAPGPSREASNLKTCLQAHRKKTPAIAATRLAARLTARMEKGREPHISSPRPFCKNR